jgi:hypothetical protein
LVVVHPRVHRTMLQGRSVHALPAFRLYHCCLVLADR